VIQALLRIGIYTTGPVNNQSLPRSRYVGIVFREIIMHTINKFIGSEKTGILTRH